MSLSPQQVRDRLTGISATDVAPIVGCHLQRAPLDVYLEKKGLAPPFPGNVRTKWGDILESPIRRDYAERMGVHVEVPGTLQHPDFDWWFASPDALVYRERARDPERGLEIKVHSREVVLYGGLHYGAPGTDEVPPHELIQCQWGMGATGLRFWDLVVFLDGYPVDYTIERDDELIGMLADRAERFLVDHVRASVPPPPDGSDAWDKWLAQRYKRHGNKLERVDTDEVAMGLIARLRKVRAELASAQDRANAVAQLVKTRIAEAAGISWREPGQLKPYSISWKLSADSHREDWRTTAQQMRLLAGLVATNDAANGRALEAIVEALGDDESDAANPAAILRRALRALTDIATMPVAETVVPGTRVFRVPTHWHPLRSERDERQNQLTEGATA